MAHGRHRAVALFLALEALRPLELHGGAGAHRGLRHLRRGARRAPRALRLGARPEAAAGGPREEAHAVAHTGGANIVGLAVCL